MKPEKLAIINKHRLCGKRDNSINFLNLRKPTKATDTYTKRIKLTCNHPEFTKLCGKVDDTDPFKYVFCIP